MAEEHPLLDGLSSLAARISWQVEQQQQQAAAAFVKHVAFSET
jgi:hypothetical protein